MNGTTNDAVPLFFARLFGLNDGSLSASATAVLQKPMLLIGGSDVLPFSVPENVWDAHQMGDSWSVYGDGKMYDDLGNEIPGNWGTVDIGDEANSTSDLGDQIVEWLAAARFGCPVQRQQDFAKQTY